MKSNMASECDEFNGNIEDFNVECVICFNDSVDDLNFGKKCLFFIQMQQFFQNNVITYFSTNFLL